MNPQQTQNQDQYDNEKLNFRTAHRHSVAIRRVALVLRLEVLAAGTVLEKPF